MLEVAREKTSFENVKYLNIPIEECSFPENSFDIVISSLAMHYVESFDKLCKEIFNMLSDGGNFIFSVEHPIFTSSENQDWYYDENENKAHWPIDNYFCEGLRTTTFLGEKIGKYHKTLTTYLSSLLKSGFILTEFLEPLPKEVLTSKFKRGFICRYT